MKLKRFSTRFLVSVGLASLLASILLGAMYIGVVPDRTEALRKGRGALGESVAAGVSALISLSDLERARAVLEFVVQRDEDLESAAVRKTDGEVVVEVGDHVSQWQSLGTALSTDSQIVVPIMAGAQSWGILELRFRPLRAPGIWGWVREPRLEMIGAVVLCALIAFYYYLGRVLRQLDPSRAIPGRVRAALDTMAEGLLVVDPKGYIVLANQAFASVSGQAPEALIGRSTNAFEWLSAGGERLESDACPWHATLQDASPQRNIIVRLEVGGKLRSLLVNCSPVLGAKGALQGVLISLDDVTELQAKEIELRIARDEAQAANRAKSDFLANMSHEIRTPMNAILGFADLLRRGYHKNDGELRRHLNTIHSSGKHLLDLINDILDLAKVESGRLELERVPCSVHAVVREVVEILGLRAKEKNLWLRFECAGPVPETVSTDPTRVRQMITNLVGNALKFTETGGITVALGLDESGPAPLFAIEVADTGIGIPAERLEAIFEPFTQAESSTTRRFGGTGLGLTISRKFARGLGGDIVARSVMGSGSVFRVTLDPGPLAGVRMLSPEEATTAAEGEALAAPAVWRFPPARVLVVDDGDANRELIRLFLEPTGLRVTGAENGQVAVDLATREPFDAILMDMEMPVMDGFTATRKLRELGVQLPIFALTANAMQGFERKVIAAGCTGYLTKPVDIDTLLLTLGELLGGEKREDAPVAANAVAEPAPAIPSGSSGPPVISRWATHPALRDAVRMFAEQMRVRMGEIERAWMARDLDAICFLAHWAKGSGGTAGYDEITAPAKALEQSAKSKDEQRIPAAIAQLREVVERMVMPEQEAA
jgi:PAS domain S-box-containing protein